MRRPAAGAPDAITKRQQQQQLSRLGLGLGRGALVGVVVLQLLLLLVSKPVNVQAFRPFPRSSARSTRCVHEGMYTGGQSIQSYPHRAISVLKPWPLI